MKSLTLIAIAAACLLSACVSIDKTPYSVRWEGAPNPLDEPGETQPTAEELHAENIKAIRGIGR